MLKAVGDNGLDDPRVANTLQKLHARARGDVWIFLRALPAAATAKITGRISSPRSSLTSRTHSVSQQGRFFVTARAIDAKRSSNSASLAISTIYLAAAARERRTSHRNRNGADKG
jgi:hypothetical protein